MQERSKTKANRESYSTLPGRLCANPTKAANASPYQVNWRSLWASAKAAVIKLKIARDIVPCGYVRQIVSLVRDDFCIFDEGKRQNQKAKVKEPDCIVFGLRCSFLPFAFCLHRRCRNRRGQVTQVVAHNRRAQYPWRLLA